MPKTECRPVLNLDALLNEYEHAVANETRQKVEAARIALVEAFVMHHPAAHPEKTITEALDETDVTNAAMGLHRLAAKYGGGHGGVLRKSADLILELLIAARDYRAELQRVATECGHPELWESAAELVRGKLMHYDELEAEHRNKEKTND